MVTSIAVQPKAYACPHKKRLLSAKSLFNAIPHC